MLMYVIVTLWAKAVVPPFSELSEDVPLLWQ